MTEASRREGEPPRPRDEQPVGGTCGSSSEESTAGVRSDPQLEAEGWVRRHLADPARAREARELYEAVGFEVLEQRLTPDDFGSACGDCPATACQSYVLLYTRRPRGSRTGERPVQRAPDAPADPTPPPPADGSPA